MAVTVEMQPGNVAGIASECFIGTQSCEFQSGVVVSINNYITASAAQLPLPSAVAGSLSSITGTNQATATYGQDINAFGDLDPRLGLISGQQNLTQAVLHRLSTKRGLFAYALNDGYDVRQLLNDSASLTTGVGLVQMQQAIEQEVEKDERIQSASALVTLDPVANVLIISMTVNTISGVTFTLVIAVNSVTLTLLQQN